jgi:transcriptional regulator with XRE-family HTH domain
MDEAADRGLVKNDSDIAAKLAVTRQSVSAWRKGEANPDPDQAAALAALLGKPEVMAECMAARAKRPDTRAMWEKAAHTLSMTVSFAAAAVVSLLLTPSPAEAAQGLGCAAMLMCIMLSPAGIQDFRFNACRIR